jgi:transposase-like protein
MGQVLHGCATTTEAVRRAIQHSQESLRGLAKRYGVNPKTVAKWRARTSVSDLPTGPKGPRSTVLSADEEAVVVAFRRHTLLPLDDCLYALRPTIPHLTRSSLHRCLQRNGISRVPQVEGESSAKRKFKAYPSGYFHIDLAEVRTAQGKLYPARRHRPNVEVRLRRDAREGGAPHRGGLPAPPDRRRPLQGPHRPH